MTLANMRANGLRSLAIRCELCHHEAVLNVDPFGEDVPVPTAWSAAASSARSLDQTGRSGQPLRA